MKSILLHCVTDMNASRCPRRNKMHHSQKTNFLNGHELLPACFSEEEELYSSPTPMTSDDIWRKFDLPTPPMSPTRDDDLDLENLTMPLGLDKCIAALLQKEMTFPETPPGPNLTSNLIQDPMWSAIPSIADIGKVSRKEKPEQRLRCDSCSGPNYSPTCVAPEDVFPYAIGGSVSQTRVHNLGTETPSDSEEEIDVVTVEKHYQVSVPIKRKRKYNSDDDMDLDQSETKTVTLTIERKPAHSVIQTVHKCETPVKRKFDCPTDVHNYSLPVTSIKRIRSFPPSPLSRTAKKYRKVMHIPSDLRKVAQKLSRASVSNMSNSSSCSSSRSSSDSEEYVCETGKRAQHNVLERKRRTDLKNSFFFLRDSVPDLEGQERAPKVVILKKASDYINKLNENGMRYEREIENLKAKREKLKRHIARLRDY